MGVIRNVDFYGLQVSQFDQFSLTSWHDYSIKEKQQQVVHGYALTMFYLVKKQPEIFQLLRTFDVFLCDGRGFYLLLKLAGLKNILYFSLPDIVIFSLEEAHKKKYSVLLFGTDEATNGIATKKIREKYQDAIICNGIHGFFNESEEEAIVEKINALSPDILMIGISSPKKERFIVNYRSRLNAKIIINCGGMIDVLAEKTKLPPRFVSKLGLAWLYRVFQEPKRLINYTLKNGLLALFIMVPRLLFEVYVKRNKNFSIPEFCGIK